MKDNNLTVIEKRVKSSLKRKVRVTLAVVVSLMINGVASAVEQVTPIVDEGSLKWFWTSNGEQTHDTEHGVEVVGDYPSADEILTSKVEVNLINLHVLTVSNFTGEKSSGIYIPGTDKLFEFYPGETILTSENSYFKVDNQGEIDVKGKSAYGIHLEFIKPVIKEENPIIETFHDSDDEEEEDPVYAYPNIEIKNSGGITATGEVEGEGIKIDTSFAKVEIENSDEIVAKVGSQDETERKEFGGATGINVLLPAEVEEPDNPTPDWIEGIATFSSDEEEISSLPMDIDIVNKGHIEATVENRDVARIIGINVGEYDDHTLTDETKLKVQLPEENEMATMALATTSTTEVAPDGIALSSSSSDHGGSGEDGGCGTKPLDAMVFNEIISEGSINITGNNLSAVQAVGINSRMPEGTQGLIENAEDAEIIVDVTLKDARQTNIDEDPTAGNLYGINVFNSGRPARVDANNNGDITVVGTIEAEDSSVEKKVTDPVGIQSFGIKTKARGRDSVADINNTGTITVESMEKQNKEDMDYTYYLDTEGKEIFGARAVGINGTSAGRGAYTEITNGGYDITEDQKAMDEKRANEDVDVYARVQADMMTRYKAELNGEEVEEKGIGNINVYAKSDQGFAQAKGIWSTAEAIENSQFVYNTKNSEITVKAVAENRGAEALGIESVSYQNYVINKGLIDVDADGKTATGIGILAEVSEIEEEVMNEHARKPEFLGADIGMPPDLPGNRDDHQGGENSGGEEESSLLAAFSPESAVAVATISLTSEDDTPGAEVSQGEGGTGEEGTTDTNQPVIGIRNKYILNTGHIDVDVNQGEVEEESEFALGAGIASSRIVLEIITEERAGDFEQLPEIQMASFTTRAMAEEEAIDDIDGVGGASVTAAPEESLNQAITNNGTIEVDVKGKVALASGMSALTKVDVMFDTDGDGVSDGLDLAPRDEAFSKNLDGDLYYDSEDDDVDGDGFYADLDGDGVPDAGNPNAPIDYFDNDSDNDGISNAKDNDDDGDGILDIDDDEFNPQDYALQPISKEAYIEFMDTPGGMPENLIETTGIVEAEEAEIYNNLTNNKTITVNALSEAAGGLAIANGIATDVVWNDLQKPVYDAPPEVPSLFHSEVEGAEITVPTIEKNYDNFANTGVMTVDAKAPNGTAVAFGMRNGSYYNIDEAASYRTPVTKHYAGDYEGEEITMYGMLNTGDITVTATGSEAKAFGIMSGQMDETDDIAEEFVVNTVKNEGKIDVDSKGGEESIGAGIVVFADQQVEYLPEVLEGGVFLAAEEDEDDHDHTTLAVEDDHGDELVFEDYTIKEPEKAVAIVENTGTINVTGKNTYGIYAGIKPVTNAEIEADATEVIKLREVSLTDENVIGKEFIEVETGTGEGSAEGDIKRIGILYTVLDGGEEYQFVVHSSDGLDEEPPEIIIENLPDAIYVVDENGNLTPSVEEAYKVGDTYLRVTNHHEITVEGGTGISLVSEGSVENSGTIDAEGGIGISLAFEGSVENSGTIDASKAIVGSGGNDMIHLLEGSKIYGDIDTGDGNDRLSLDSGSYTEGRIHTGRGNDRLEISQGAKLRGNIHLGDGNDRLSLAAESDIEGDIFTGRGNDRVEVYQGAKLTGSIDLGDGNDFFTLKGGGFAENGTETTYTVDGGEGYDRITLIGSEENSDQNFLDRKMQNFEMAKITGDWKLKHADGLNMSKRGRIINKGRIEFEGGDTITKDKKKR